VGKILRIENGEGCFLKEKENFEENEKEALEIALDVIKN